ncbi:Leukocyte receptor cluster-like protein [Hirschfeldia incana]|nr:Leukocyte receptor cluster-like protein [Hirschfeldia incana]KAJ0233003.1 Leukocyte receptor cluster-like protein [Hirschfeldia incana]
MGGHGGLNILPQKRWNVYNFDNREKVRKDEEAAAKEAQIQREEARKRDAQSRLEVLRNVRGLAPLKRPSPEEADKGKDTPAPAPASTSAAVKKIVEPEEEPKTGHINLFEGIKIFDPIELPKKDDYKPGEEEDHRRKKMRKEAAATARASAKDAAARAGDPDEEKYRLGYGVAGKGVKLPWYVENKRKYEDDRVGGGEEEEDGRSESMKKSGKKSLKELREERLKRERVEKERERALFMKQSQRSGGFSRRR